MSGTSTTFATEAVSSASSPLSSVDAWELLRDLISPRHALVLPAPDAN